MRVVLTIAFLLSFTNSYAKKKAVLSFPQTYIFENKMLKLNGTGWRLATFFNIKVYKAALYLERPSKHADEIINSNSFKVIKLHFVREIDGEKIKKTWEENEGFKGFEAEVTKLNSYMESIIEDDTMTFEIKPNLIKVSIKGKKKGEISKKKFGTAFLSIFIGPNPPNEELKDGFLNIKN